MSQTFGSWGVVFDLDGTLIDTLNLLKRSFAYAAREVLGEGVSDEYFVSTIGRPLTEQMWGYTDDQAVHDALVAAYRYYGNEVDQGSMREFDGVREMLDELARLKVPVGVATSKLHHYALRNLKQFNYEGYFGVLIGADDVAHPKPAGDSVIAAAAGLGLPVDRILYVGDAPFDIQAAHDAGTRGVAVKWGQHPIEELLGEQPEYVADSPADIVRIVSELKRAEEFARVKAAADAGAGARAGADASARTGVAVPEAATADVDSTTSTSRVSTSVPAAVSLTHEAEKRISISERVGRPLELLAPAGGFEQLEYALAFGADAVYLSADKYGMRARAENFTLDTIGEAVSYAHERGARVYAAVNIQLHEDDMEDFGPYVRALDEAGVDAFIVGDLGALSLVKEYAPRPEIHVSTQASVSNARAAKMWIQMGARRIVVAREMSIADIARMREEIPDDVDIEAFVHGAMCMAVSGRCLISDYLTGRSATTGNCTQPCRWKYHVVEEKRPGEYFPIEQDERGSYIFNAKDLNMIHHLEELARAGVNSFKIEGRNKKAFYVASVVNAYRKVMDGAPLDLYAAELETVSHRPYSTGFYLGQAEQSYASDAYVRTYEWAAHVISSHEVAPGMFDTHIRLRNRFSEGEMLEVLSPFGDVAEVKPEHLRWVNEVGKEYPTEVANRAMDEYVCTLPIKLHSKDILRRLKS